MEWHKDSYMISDDSNLIDLESVAQLLSSTSWASNRTKETIIKSIHNSITFGLYEGDKQIGFARVITDKAVFSWILDVVIDENYRRKGLGYWLMECIIKHPEIKHTKFALATLDAHDFYKKFQFVDNQFLTRNSVNL
ncbi:GNAT family N-acetyltransferase [Bacillus sp. SD088]|uniref:GNAT family N-acetyltransferase n=1 Tax=Bacillus sp. SD088 TaxID=2782012 RepID=UPI001A95DB33|nr:GNAT family N-acetyltransferase [Bacillus sp. SD088]MBO0992877.1 GNAT family N-acetyltransferase [Bacillus sp. SD088]